MTNDSETNNTNDPTPPAGGVDVDLDTITRRAMGAVSGFEVLGQSEDGQVTAKLSSSFALLELGGLDHLEAVDKARIIAAMNDAIVSLQAKMLEQLGSAFT